MPDCPSPKTSRCGSVSGSSATGASSFSLMPSSSRSGSPVAARRPRGHRTVVELDPLGQQPQLRPGRPRPGRRDALDQVARPRRPGCSAPGSPSMRGSAARKCSLPGTRPRPGRPVGTSAATLRSISESIGSPSRSSSRVPNRSRIAARKSAHRAAPVTMCSPKVRPRAARCWSSISRSSKSERSVLQPSTTRKTSPYPSSARPCGAPAAGRSRSSRCRWSRK